MLHAARTSVHHRGARAPDAGKALLGCAIWLAKENRMRPLTPDAEPGMAATPGLAR